ATGSLFHDLSVLRQLHFEFAQRLDELGDSAGVDLHWRADDEPGVETIGGHEIRGLEFPISETAVDDLEAERAPLDGAEHRRWIGRRRRRRRQLEHDLRL